MRFLRTVLCIVGAAACARGVDDAAPDDGNGVVVDSADAGDRPPVADAGADAALPIPAKMADRIGVYAWGFDDRAFAGFADRLTWAADRVRQLGSRTIRVYIGPKDTYQLGNPGGTATFSLVDAAKAPAYAALFANPAFETYLLTAYTKDDDATVWKTGYAPDAAAAERKAVADFGAHLLSTYPNKKFILLNWEGDNAVAPFASNTAAWDGFAAWTQARADGAKDARAGAGGAGRFFSGVEFNKVAGCDGQNRCIVSTVLPKVDVDYYAYSAWGSIGEDVDTGAIAARVTADLDRALGFAKVKEKSRFIVGEFGAEREASTFGECTAAKRIAATVSALTAWGAAYGVFWQIIDNPPSSGALPQIGFGAFKSDLSPTLAGDVLHALYTTENPGVPNSTCPVISQGGVVDGKTYKAPVRAGAVVSIFGDGFSNTAEVHVVQKNQMAVVSDGTPWFYRDGKQMNFTLPPAIVANDKVLVFVRNGTGPDSNGQYLDVVP
jgi:hypothetical protein